MFGASGICSKSSCEHLPESFEHLIANSEHLDTVRGIARLVGSVRKAPKKVAYRSRGAQANICGVRRCYARLVREGNARGGGAVIHISPGNCQCKHNGTEKGRFRGAFFRIGTTGRSDIAERQG